MSEPQPGARIVDRDANVNGITLRYATWGSYISPERAIMMVHGITANSRSFAASAPILAAQGWYVIAPDLRGRGLSSKPAHGYGVFYHVDDVLALGDALGLSKINLVGHSLGAQIVLFLAALHPERVNRVVLVDRGDRLPADAVENVGATLKRLGQVYPSLDAFLEERRQAPVYEWNPYWEEYFRYDAAVAADGTVSSRMPRHALEQELTANELQREDAATRMVRAPTLVVRAELGILGPTTGFILPPEEAERLRSIIPNCQVIVIPGTNHYTVTLPEAFAQALAQFFGQAPAASAT
jgi:pimeloyl-ACP methyl ester carboxylesterase